MGGREYLGGYIRNKRLIERLKREAEEIETMLTSAAIDYSREKVQTSPQGDRWAEAIDRLTSIHAAITEAMTVALEEAGRVQEAIDGVSDPVLREILWRRWIKGETMEQIAEAMHRDVRWIYRLHRRAIDHVQARR